MSGNSEHKKKGHDHLGGCSELSFFTRRQRLRGLKTVRNPHHQLFNPSTLSQPNPRGGNGEVRYGRACSKTLTVHPLSTMMNDLLDQPLSLEMTHSLAGEGTVDLHSFDEDGLGDHLVGGDFFHDLVAVWAEGEAVLDASVRKE